MSVMRCIVFNIEIASTEAMPMCNVHPPLRKHMSETRCWRSVHIEFDTPGFPIGFDRSFSTSEMNLVGVRLRRRKPPPLRGWSFLRDRSCTASSSILPTHFVKSRCSSSSDLTFVCLDSPAHNWGSRRWTGCSSGTRSCTRSSGRCPWGGHTHWLGARNFLLVLRSGLRRQCRSSRTTRRRPTSCSRP